MGVTTWDGHLRIDHLADTATVAVTLLTVEPTTQTELRTGLVAGFVSTDPDGPPAFVAFALRDGRVPDDIAALLGPRVSAAVAELLDTGRPGEWLQLDLVEVDDLATAWLPYRARVASTTDAPVQARTGTLGSWAEELWTCLGLPGLGDALRGRQPAGQFRGEPTGEEPDSPVARGTWRLPDELAAAVGVQPEVSWTMVSAAGDTVRVDLALRATGRPAPAVLRVSADDGSQRWVGFDADPSGGLHASVTGPDRPWNLRFRSENRNPA